MAVNSIGKMACMGAIETQPSSIISRLWSPTDFDFSMENMRKRIRDTVPFIQGWRMLGLVGGPLQRWLIRYIETANQDKTSYVPENKETWYSVFMQKYAAENYRKEDLIAYFDTLYTLYKEGQVTKSIYAPYTYVPEKETGPAQAITRTARTVGIGAAVTVIAAVGLYAFIQRGGKRK